MTKQQNGEARAEMRLPGGFFFVAISAFILSMQLLIPAPSLAQETCGSTGAHEKHGPFDCTTCHLIGGAVCFDPNGRAFGSGLPAPTFDTAYRTCSNIACHTVLPGTYSYYRYNGDDAELITVTYGSTEPTVTPNWFDTIANCTACHGNPPPPYAWHSGNHTNGRVADGNECQLCHPDASSVGGVGTTITDPTLHGNRVVNVEAQWKSTCFYCH